MNTSARTNWQPTPFRILAASVAAGSVIAANVLMLAAQPLYETDVALPERPAAITGIAAPSVRPGLDLDDIEFVVPVLDRPEIRLPDLPEVELGPLLGRGVMSAPSTPIQVQAPEAAIDVFGTQIEAPSLQRPDLPAPPPVR